MHQHAIEALEKAIDQIAEQLQSNQCQLEKLESLVAWCDKDRIKRLQVESLNCYERIESIENTIGMLKGAR